MGQGQDRYKNVKIPNYPNGDNQQKQVTTWSILDSFEEKTASYLN